jgi:hypothetical protein
MRSPHHELLQVSNHQVAPISLQHHWALHAVLHNNLTNRLRLVVVSHLVLLDLQIGGLLLQNQSKRVQDYHRLIDHLLTLTHLQDVLTLKDSLYFPLQKLSQYLLFFLFPLGLR